MILNLLWWLVLILLTLSFAYLVIRAWRSRRGLVRWAGSILAALLTLLLALVTLAVANGLYQIYSPRGSPVTELKVAGTSEQVTRGEHLAASLCVACHAENDQLPLSGGRDVTDDLPLPVGHAFSINLTPAGPLKDWSDGEILRVLREGVDREGHPLIAMSVNGVRYLSDEDKQAVIAYLRSQPPVTKIIPDPPDQTNLLFALLVGAGVFKFQPPVAAAVSAPPKAATAEYGRYVVDYESCRLCHGEDLTGGTDPVSPHGPNLRVVKGWTADQFVSTIRTGKDPGGHTLSTVMPWRDFARLDDVELQAVYAYLKSLGATQ